MIKEEFIALQQQQHLERDRSLKKFLIDVGISYSNHNTWNKKFNQAETSHKFAPIKFTTASVKVSSVLPLIGDVPSGVTLLFPNGLKVYFGAGIEDVFTELLNLNLSCYVLS